ncbi:MAG: carbohydrate kinase, partial [Mesorhizobium sp.]
ALGASKVSSTYAHTSPRPTTLAFVRLTNGQATYTFYDENTAGRMLTIKDLPELGSEIEAMLFGAISLISEPAGSAYEEFMRREHERRVMMLDPNIRPNFIPDKAKHLRR